MKKPREKGKVLRTEKKTISFNCPKRGLVEQEIEVKVYEEQIYTRDDSLASEILSSDRNETFDED